MINGLMATLLFYMMQTQNLFVKAELFVVCVDEFISFEEINSFRLKILLLVDLLLFIDL